jgi:hypothetical protein
MIQDLCLIPLQDGTWTSAKGQSMFFCKNDTSLDIPSGIEVFILDSSAESDPNRRKLFTSLGVKDWEASEISRLILEVHQAPGFDSHTLTVDQLISHAVFLYKASWQPPKTADLWFATVQDKRCLGRKLYMPGSTEISSSAARIFVQLQKQFPLLHADYLKAFPDDPDWPVWLATNLGLSRIPRLVAPYIYPKPEPARAFDFEGGVASNENSGFDTFAIVDDDKIDDWDDTAFFDDVEFGAPFESDIAATYFENFFKDSPDDITKPLKRPRRPKHVYKVGDQVAVGSASRRSYWALGTVTWQGTQGKHRRYEIRMYSSPQSYKIFESASAYVVPIPSKNDYSIVKDYSLGQEVLALHAETGIFRQAVVRLTENLGASVALYFQGADIKDSVVLVERRFVLCAEELHNNLPRVIKRQYTSDDKQPVETTRILNDDTSCVESNPVPGLQIFSIQHRQENILKEIGGSGTANNVEGVVPSSLAHDAREIFALSDEFKFMFTHCNSTDVLQLLSDNGSHYSQWIDGVHMKWQSSDFIESGTRLKKSIEDCLVNTTRGPLPLQETVLPMIDQRLDEECLIPAVDITSPLNSGWSFLSYFGVIIKGDIQYYLRCLIALSGELDPCTDTVAYIYEQIQVRYNGNEELIR